MEQVTITDHEIAGITRTDKNGFRTYAPSQYAGLANQLISRGIRHGDGTDAELRGLVDAKIVVIMGAVTGSVTAGEKLEIQATGSVTGDIVSQLVIVNGGHLHGKVQIPPSDCSRTPQP